MKSIFILGILAIFLISSCSPEDKIANDSLGDEDAIVKQEIIEGIGKGELPPDFTIATIEGKHISLRQFKDDKPVLIYFFAAWCPYCSKDFDAAKKVYPNYKDKVKFIAIDLDINEKNEAIAEYSKSKNLSDLDFGEADAGILKNYAVTKTTTKYAIGKNGLILYKGSGVFDEKQWDILLNALANS